MPELISQAIVDLFNPPLPQTLLDKSQANSQYSPQILRSIVYNPPGGVIAVILEEMDKIAEHAERGTTRWKLIASQLQLRSVRRGMGLLRDEIYWKLGLINIHPQSKSIPRGLGKKEIKRVLNSLNYSNTVRASRQSLNLWEISAR
jgi:hypothetical protein